MNEQTVQPAANPSAPGQNAPGQSVFSPQAWGDLAHDLSLSPRELEIVQCIFRDQKEAAIAARLGMSPHTVHTHLGRLYRKLHTASRCGVILLVLRTYLERVGSADEPPKPAAQRIEPSKPAAQRDEPSKPAAQRDEPSKPAAQRDALPAGLHMTPV
jgi:DNA-binding CsgD family transcriptional regulator